MTALNTSARSSTSVRISSTLPARDSSPLSWILSADARSAKGALRLTPAPPPPPPRPPPPPLPPPRRLPPYPAHPPGSPRAAPPAAGSPTPCPCADSLFARAAVSLSPTEDPRAKQAAVSLSSGEDEPPPPPSSREPLEKLSARVAVGARYHPPPPPSPSKVIPRRQGENPGAPGQQGPSASPRKHLR